MSDVYDLPYNQVSFKASHNSYDRSETLVQQLAWNSSQPWQGGCRGLELDINESRDGNRWSVGHVGGFDESERTLALFLDELTKWSADNQGHDVVTLYLDLKSVYEGFQYGLDSYITEWLKAPIYRPVELMGSYDTLEKGAQYNGWPTLRQLAGKFIVVLSGDSGAKETYAHDNPRARLCFADKNFEENEAPHSQTRVFFNYDLSERDYDQWGPVFRAQAPHSQTIMRGYVINDEDLWEDALNSGANLLSTDKVSDHSWAQVGGGAAFLKLKPLG